MAKLTNTEKEASKLAEHLDLEKVCNFLLNQLFIVLNPEFTQTHRSARHHALSSLPSFQCHAKTTEDLSRVLESTRNHLEIQLSQAEKEKVRLSAQIQVSK